jgi:hypothetical protein
VLVEVLYFEGCPNTERARALLERVSDELGVRPEIRMIEIADADEAQRTGFLGSPSIRVDGRDVEPGATERGGASFACRIYRTEGGVAGVPDERWLRAALTP